MRGSSNHINAVKATKKEWIGLAVLALPTLLLALDMSVLFLALPHLGEDLSPSSTEMLWIMDIYGFMIAGFLVTMGTLGDRIGRRKLLIIGAGAFGLASILAAFSNSAEMLIATRAFLGIAGATLMPSTLALISNMFKNNQQRAVAISVWMTCFMVGTIIGPLIGGALLEYFWWGSVFLLGVPVMALLLVLAPIFLPEFRDEKSGRIDLVSVLLSLTAILSIIFGLKELAKDGFSGIPLISILCGLIIGFFFVKRQKSLTEPIIDLNLFASRSFSISLGINMIVAVILAGNFLYISLYLQLVEGLSPLNSGLWFIPPTVALIIGSLLAPLITQWIRPSFVIGTGLMIAAIGALVLTQLESTGGLPVLITGFVILGLGFGPLGVLATDLIVGSAPPEKAGAASALSETSAELGVACGIAFLGSLGTAVYKVYMESFIPANIPAEISKIASESLSGAASVVSLSPVDSQELLQLAREAFTTGFNVVAALSALLVLIFGVFAFTMLRYIPPNNRMGDHEKPENKELRKGEEGHLEMELY